MEFSWLRWLFVAIAVVVSGKYHRSLLFLHAEFVGRHAWRFLLAHGGFSLRSGFFGTIVITIVVSYWGSIGGKNSQARAPCGTPGIPTSAVP